MRLDIKSKNYGVVTFTARETSGVSYIFCSINGADDRQMIEGGFFTRGNTVVASARSFDRACRKWWSAFLRNNRDSITY